MPLPAHIALSPLPPLASFLVEHGVRDEELIEAIDEADGYEDAAPAMVAGLGRVLDEWLACANQVRYEQDAFAAPYVYLATSEHIGIVQAFRELLP